MQSSLKRCLSLVMALVMVFSLVPVQAFAEETDAHSYGGDTISVSEPTTTETVSVDESEHVHSYEETVTAPDCGNKGYSIYVCPCGDSYTASETEATGLHSYEATVVDPTTETEGYTQYTCSVCGDSYIGDFTEKLPAEDEEKETKPEETESEETEPEGSALVQQIQSRINAILIQYGVTAEMADREIANAIIAVDGNTLKATMDEIDALEQIAQGLTETEFEGLDIDIFVRFCTIMDQLNSTALIAAKTNTVLDGQVSITDSSGTGSLSNGTVTITAKGSLFSKATNTVTITNETANTATLAFDYTASTYNSFTIAGASASASGTYSGLLDAGASVTLVIKSNSGFSNLTATLKLSNFSLTAAATSSNVTFNYDSALGSVTAGGTVVTSGTTQEVSLTDGVALVATANSGVRFLGWINEADGTIISPAASYTLTPAADVTVKAVFAKDGGTPWFMLGTTTNQSVSSGLLGWGSLSYQTVSGTHLFENLNDAAIAADSSTSKAIVLMNDGTLPAGNYTIPAGVTLLIPFDDANTMYTTQVVNTGTYTKPTAYRTLTLASDANLTINGAMSISAKQKYANGADPTNGGAPTGKVGFVKMEGSSNITVNNGGALYAYGFITGSGSVTANSGATVYEMFQFSDFRGGTQSTDMENGVFPLSQYYVQNIEVPMTLYSGAKEYAYTTIYMSSADFGSAVAFISNSGAMFNLTSGYVVKKYDGATDRLIVDAHGDLTLSSINMTVGTSSINSKNYELPINSNITVNIYSGSITINQDVALLPGSQIYVAEGATCKLGSGYNIYIYDADQWGAFASSLNRKWIPVAYAPGKTYTRTEADLVDASIRVEGTVDASAGYVYTTSGGANIYSTGSGVAKIKPGTQTVTYQLVQGTGYTEIPLTSAKLQNADSTYVESTGTSGTYNYTDGVWVKTCNHEYNEEITTPAGCETEGLKTFTCPCGESYTEEIPATGHTSGTEATCTTAQTCTVCSEELAPAKGHTPGAEATCTTAQTCTVCGTELVAAKGHTEVVDAAVAPTCIETGLTEGKHCSVCSEVLVAQEVVPALDHTPGAEATCTTAQTCSVCGEELAEALGHTEVIDAAVAPTCTKTGLTEGKHCSVCNEVLVAQEVVAANGHTEVIDEAVAATCTSTGLTEGKHCSACNEVLAAQEEVPALGHTPGAEATCTTAQTCTVCSAELETAKGHTPGAEATCTTAQICTVCDEELVAALGHNLVTDAAVDPTCTNPGYQTGAHCSRCDYTEGGGVIPALGHDMDAGTVTTTPTCTEKGVKTFACSRCDHTETEDIAALGHTEVVDAAVAPTCTETGLTEGKHCSVCNEVLVAQTIVAALGHTEVVDVAVAPTCTATGLTEGKHCSVCNEVLVAQEEVAALGHTEVVDAAVEATCTETGLSEGKHCSVCNEVLVAQEVVDALGHTEVVDAAVAASCTETGLTEGKHCSVCNEVLVAQTVVAALGHTEVIDAAVEATCTETGLTEGKHCSVCNEVLVVQVEVAAVGHTEIVDAAVEATCSAVGLTEGKHCSVCNEILVAQETIEKLPHTEENVEAMPALCETPGHTIGVQCSVCGEVLSGVTEIPALGHDIVQHEAKQPTYGNVGWEAYEDCSRCGYTTYVEIPALDVPSITTYEDFLTNLSLMEEMARAYVLENPGKDPLNLIIKYIRTGVERYNSGSWGIMAGYEDKDFAEYVSKMEDAINSVAPSEEEMIAVSSLKNIENFYLPNGDYVDFGHMFGTMDITYHNNGSVNHADVAGWAGDIVDLVSLADQFGVGEAATVDEMVTYITENYLLKHETELVATFGQALKEGTFSLEDMYGDLDGFYIMQMLYAQDYENGALTAIMQAYFTETLSIEDRADYFLKNRLDGASLRSYIRNAVYNAYTGNKVISTLEGTRDFETADLTNLRMACCYAFADYICKLAGDYVDVTDNRYYTVFSSESSTLAPGITQEIKYATSADNKQMVYYIATADITRDDVQVYANYNNNDPASGWAMQRVLDQANAAQEKYGNPESEHYIPNYNVIASTNGAGYNMSTGEPGGLLVMGGVEYHAINANGFFGILKDGTPVIGTTEEYNTIYKGQLQEGIAAFGATLVKDGKVSINRTEDYYTNRASRTAVGITATGKVVLMVLDGRQEPFSCGGSMEEIAQIMLEAGCVHAVNLDGGGSTTYVAKQAGTEELAVINRPSDGYARSVATSLMIVSTAPSSTAFDHAVLESENDYLTIGTSVQITARGVSATGNTAEIPEGTSWVVSDERWATITEDGVFTALRNGSVEVSLVLGEEVIGSKTMNIVAPDNVYFTKTNINAVYGQSVELPVKALYEGKEVAIQASDLEFTLSNAVAGTIDGFIFTAAENSGYKSVKVTAVLANNADVTASVTVSLYNQGEVSFDFDQATGGDRQMAWDRQVSNSTTDDAITYEVVNAEEDMVTSYTFAIDMTQIPIPQQLSDLIYMLPGADAENASAWNFLLQLAERVSVLSEVKPVIRFDPDVEVDYSNLKLVNDYFELNGTEFDETSNTLTLTLNWIDQTAAIDPETANPLCIVSGIKLTPKADADWGTKNSLSIENSGEISYKIYLRASGLYSFAQKPENQATYGLQPFVNPNDESEKGGWFGDIYNTFEDSYTLVNSVKEGWITEDGGFAYYENGVKHTGIKLVDGLYYDFGENGINVGKTPYSGLFQENGGIYYTQLGEIVKGWHSIGEDWYLFDWTTGEGKHGTYPTTIQGVSVTYEFENGKLVKGYWYDDGEGIRYYYGPYYYNQGWKVIDGESYFFENYHVCTGVRPIRPAHATYDTWYEFTNTGVLVGEAEDGLHWYNGNLYYVVDAGSEHTGFYLIDGDYYYFQTNHTAIVGKTNWAGKTNDLLPAGTYRFDKEGKVIMTAEVVNEDGTLYYYRDGMRINNAGLVECNGHYYRIGSGGIAVVNQASWVGASNECGFEAGYYLFGEDGKLSDYTGIRTEDGVMYYYRNGMRANKANLIEFEGAYYHIGDLAKVTTNAIVWISANASNGLVSQGDYEFGPDGKMIIYQGVVNGYYYVDGIKTAAGLVQQDGDYYFAGSGGKLKANEVSWISKNNDLLPAGTYRFAADGKIIMTEEVVNENGTLYYYRDGRRIDNAGLVKLGDDFYRIGSGGIAVTNEASWIGASNAYGFTAGYYLFGEDGKLSDYTGIRTEADAMYYYRNGMRINKANLIEFEGAYYHIGELAKVTINATVWISTNASNGLWPQGDYEFGPDGKMIIYHGVANGHYYVNGIKTAAGLVQQDGDYYFAGSGGKLKADEVSWISKNNGLLPAGTYRFAADGKIIMTEEVVNENGTLYYYREGRRIDNAGLVKVNGEYYRIEGGGIAATNVASWIGASNAYGFEAGYYLFGEDGKLSDYTGIRTEADAMYYYRNGMRINKANLIEFEGAYYHIGEYAKVTTNATVWISTNASNGLWPQGDYEFGPDGKMIIYHGVANGYYYVNGIKTAAGLVQQDGNYYFAGSGGKLKANEVSWISKNNDLLPAGTYRFAADGKIIMTEEVVNENGTLYYYRDGRRIDNAGLVKLGDDFYRIGSGGIAVTNEASWIGTSNAYGFTAGYYLFGEDGKLSDYTGIRTEADAMYYYRNGMRINKANLIEFEGAYYHIGELAKVTTNATVWISTNASNGLVKQGNYTFGPDGKMIVD